MTSTSYRTGTTNRQSGAAAPQTLTLTVPATVNAGDLLVLGYGLDSSTSDAGGQATISSPSGITGWTQLSAQQALSAFTAKGWYKIATSGDPGSVITLSYTVTTTGPKASAVLSVYTGVDGSAPVPVIATPVTSTASTTTHTAATINTTGSGTCRIVSLLMFREPTASATITPSATWTLRDSTLGSGTGGNPEAAVIDSGTDQAAGSGLGGGAVTTDQPGNFFIGWTIAIAESTSTALAVATASLPNGTAGVPYSQTVTASGGTGPYSWQGGGSRVASLVGFDVAKGTWTTANNKIGPGQLHRLFYSGALPSAFDDDGTPDNVVIIASYKTQTTNVVSYVTSIPPSRQVVIIYHHEPENDYSAGSTFVAEFKTQSTLIRAHAGSNVKIAMCAEGYKYGAGNSADAKAGNYIRGLGPYVDYFTVDVYQGHDGTAPSGAWDWPSNGLANFPDWQNWLAVATDESITGKIVPLAITEYGIYDPVGNTVRNARLQLDAAYLESSFPAGGGSVSPFPLAHWAYWWETNTSPDPQFTDAATIATWQAIETTAGSDLPPGLSLASDGTISGTPQGPGTWTFSVTVTDHTGVTASGDITLTVANAGASGNGNSAIAAFLC